MSSDAVQPHRRRQSAGERPQLPRVTLSRNTASRVTTRELKTANLSLDTADAEQVFNSAETWEKVVVKLRSRAMPPTGQSAAGQRHV